jgi:hypothetical protein
LWHEETLLARLTSVTSFDAEAFQDARNRACYEVLCASGSLQQAALALDSELRAHVESLLQRLRAGPTLSLEAAQEDVIKCALRLRRDQITRLIRELRFMQQDAQEQADGELVRELNTRIEALGRDHLELDRQTHAATLVGRKEAREQKSAGNS